MKNVNDKLNSIAPMSIASFARDIAIYGQEKIDDIIEAYEITEEAALLLMDSPVFKTEYGRVLKQMEDPHGGTRLKAQDLLQVGIDEVRDIMLKTGKPADKLKAFSIVQGLAGVQEERTQPHVPVMLSLSFGGLVHTHEQNKELQAGVTYDSSNMVEVTIEEDGTVVEWDIDR